MINYRENRAIVKKIPVTLATGRSGLDSFGDKKIRLTMKLGSPVIWCYRFILSTCSVSSGVRSYDCLSCCCRSEGEFPWRVPAEWEKVAMAGLDHLIHRPDLTTAVGNASADVLSFWLWRDAGRDEYSACIMLIGARRGGFPMAPIRSFCFFLYACFRA